LGPKFRGETGSEVFVRIAEARSGIRDLWKEKKIKKISKSLISSKLPNLSEPTRDSERPGKLKIWGKGEGERKREKKNIRIAKALLFLSLLQFERPENRRESAPGDGAVRAEASGPGKIFGKN
jgi:hypothetical protein